MDAEIRRNQPPRSVRIASLHHSIVKRKGLKAKEWYGQTDLASVCRPKSKGDPDELSIFFTLPAGGQVDTMINVCIKPEDFPTILAFMSATDRDATMKTMVEEMRYQICGAMD